jgi:hypothetical protein
LLVDRVMPDATHFRRDRDEARLVEVEFERKLGEPFPQIIEQLGRISLALETDDRVNGIAHDARNNADGIA